MAEDKYPPQSSFVEAITQGPADRPAALKELSMDLLMIIVQMDGIISYLADAATLSKEVRDEVAATQKQISNRIDSVIDTLQKLDNSNG